MQVKPHHIQSACKTAAGKMRVEKFYPYFEKYFNEYGIKTIGAEIMFIAQVMHESGEFRYTKELGSDKYLDKYDTGKLAENLGNTPEDDDDGQKYRGRGLIQVTGKNNYERLSADTGIDFLKSPDLLEMPEYATMSACWFWRKKNLSSICSDIIAVTKRINGGYNGIDDRQSYWNSLSRAIQ